MNVAKNNFIFTSALGIPFIMVALISWGPLGRRLLTSGIGIIVAGFAISLYYWKKGQKAEQNCDERENFIVEKSMRFTFYVMAIAIQFYWAYNFTGHQGDFLFILLGIFWGSFLAAYVFNRLRV